MFTTRFARTILAVAITASVLAVPTATATPTPAPLSPRVTEAEAPFAHLTPMTPSWAHAVDGMKSEFSRVSAHDAGYASTPQIGCYDPIAYYDHAHGRCLRVTP